MTDSEATAEPHHIPIRVEQIAARLNQRVLPHLRKYVHYDRATGSYYLIDLAKSRKLSREQFEELARDHVVAADPAEVFVWSE